MTYHAPLDRMRFTIERLIAEAHAAAPGLYAELTPDLVAAVLGSAGRYAEDVLAPLNTVGDREGARLTAEGVSAPPGFREAYAQLVEDARRQARAHQVRSLGCVRERHSRSPCN